MLTVPALIETTKVTQLESYDHIKYLLDHIGAADSLK